MQNFKECAHVLDIACSQLTNHQSSNGLNGHHLQNGFSGCHVTNGNGFTTNGRHNGTNGHISVSNKRCYDDESIPLFKRARTAGSINSRSDSCDDDVTMDSIDVTMEAGTPHNSQNQPIKTDQRTSAEKYVMGLQGIPQYEDELFSYGEWPGDRHVTRRRPDKSAKILESLNSHYF
uniref:Uncharacterized protein n=1 Tax=Ciona savignyi TaxID=51511 RepID=H2YEI7_CIOSA